MMGMELPRREGVCQSFTERERFAEGEGLRAKRDTQRASASSERVCVGACSDEQEPLHSLAMLLDAHGGDASAT
jgi:hypothetical protein